MSRVTSCFGLAGLIAAAAIPASAATYMLSGNDQKVEWNKEGKQVFGKPGTDSISIIDIGADPANPKIVASLPLMNSIFGPPTNMVVTPDGSLALVANSMEWTEEGDSFKPAPGKEVYLIDLESTPPTHIGSIEVGEQPSGMAISQDGKLVLIANRAGKSVSVVTVEGKSATLTGNVDMGEQVAAVAIAPDGKRALVAKFPAHKIALLEIDGTNVSYGGYDIPVGLWPYNVAITPDGKLALTADNGNAGGSDGQVDTVTVIDMEADPPRAIDKVVVGDAPEGLAISPTGEIAVAVLLNGSAAVPEGAWYANANGVVAVLSIDGKKVVKEGEVEVGRLPEGVVFSPDGRWLYIGNFVDSDVSILEVDGTTVTDTGKKLDLPGRPGSMRAAR